MKHCSPTLLLFLLIFIGLNSCNQSAKQPVQQSLAQTAIDSNQYLLQVCDANDNCGYANLKGDTVIALGKYIYCFTDTFRSYAFVVIKDSGFAAIDRNEKVLYKVFPFDNGPDYSSEGLFRIMTGNKIGYADSATGAIVIAPQFDCAFPFVNGVAQVSKNCKTVREKGGEHSSWLSEHWEYIDKTGNQTAAPKAVAE